MADHAKLSPSSASRWMNCPGSIEMVELYEDEDTGNPFAHEGTILHGIMEDCLRHNRDPYDWLDEVVPLSRYRDERDFDQDFELTITEELCDMLIDGLDMIDTIPGKIFLEHRVDLNRWLPKQFGTLDVGIIGKRRIHIWDHKFGMVPVSPIQNKQISSYALGFWDNIARHHTDVTNFRFHVWQPRCHAGDGGGQWDTTLDELLVFGEEMREKGRVAQTKNAPRIPGPIQCQYCPGAKYLKCPEYVKYNKALLFGEDDDQVIEQIIQHDIPPRITAAHMTAEERSYIVTHRSMLNKFIDNCAAATLDDAIKGGSTPGLKAVSGRRPARKWKDPEKASMKLARILGEDAFARKVKSPTQIEKDLTETMFGSLSEYIESGEPKPILVPIEDSRPMITSLRDLFDDDEDEDPTF